MYISINSYNIYFYISVYMEICNYLISVNTETTINTYFTTYTQVILRKCHKSIAPYISNY